MWHLLVAAGAGYFARCLQNKATWSRKRPFTKDSPTICKIPLCSTCCGSRNDGEKLVHCICTGGQLVVDCMMDSNLQPQQVYSHDNSIRVASIPIEENFVRINGDVGTNMKLCVAGTCHEGPAHQIASLQGKEGGLICAAILYMLLLKNVMKEELERLMEGTQGLVNNMKKVLDEFRTHLFLEANFSRDKKLSCKSIQVDNGEDNLPTSVLLEEQLEKACQSGNMNNLSMVQNNLKDMWNLLYGSVDLDSSDEDHISSISMVPLRDGISYSVFPCALEKRLLRVIQERQEQITELEGVRSLTKGKLHRDKEDLSSWRERIEGHDFSGEYNLHGIDPEVVELHGSAESWNQNCNGQWESIMRTGSASSLRSQWEPIMRTGSASSIRSEESIISIDLTASNLESGERHTFGTHL